MTLTLGRGNGIIIGNPGGITLATSRGALTVGGAGGVALRQGDPLRLSGGNVVGVPTGGGSNDLRINGEVVEGAYINVTVDNDGAVTSLTVEEP